MRARQWDSLIQFFPCRPFKNSNFAFCSFFRWNPFQNDTEFQTYRQLILIHSADKFVWLKSKVEEEMRAPLPKIGIFLESFRSELKKSSTDWWNEKSARRLVAAALVSLIHSTNCFLLSWQAAFTSIFVLLPWFNASKPALTQNKELKLPPCRLR